MDKEKLPTCLSCLQHNEILVISNILRMINLHLTTLMYYYYYNYYHYCYCCRFAGISGHCDLQSTHVMATYDKCRVTSIILLRT